jgi:hypothetical protein
MVKSPPRWEATIEPSLETLIRFQNMIALGQPKPEGLSAQESAEWVALASEIAEAEAKGYILTIPNE